MHPGFVSTTVAVGRLLAVGGVPRTSGALAVELIDLVQAVAVVQAGAAGALVRVDLTVNPLVACRETQHCQHPGTGLAQPHSRCTPGPPIF